MMVAPRPANPTVRFVDEYCESYRDLFIQVRSFEAFKHLHVSAIAELPRKSLPVIAKVNGLPNAQSLLHSYKPAQLVFVDEAGVDDTHDYPYGYCHRSERFHDLKLGHRTELVSMVSGWSDYWSLD